MTQGTNLYSKRGNSAGSSRCGKQQCVDLEKKVCDKDPVNQERIIIIKKNVLRTNPIIRIYNDLSLQTYFILTCRGKASVTTPRGSCKD